MTLLIFKKETIQELVGTGGKSGFPPINATKNQAYNEKEENNKIYKERQIDDILIAFIQQITN